MPPQIFKNRVIAAAGPLPGQLSADNVKRWTENRRGRFSEEVDDSVTHVLCTRAQFRKKVPRIRQALALGQMGKKVQIVHCDWFEESTVHNRKLPEHEYSMKKREAERRAAEREKKRIERGIANGEKFVNTNYYHIYRDREFFPYQIEVVQYDETTGNPSYKWSLFLWESNAKPHLHWFTAKLLDKNPGKANKPKYHKGSDHAVKWRVAFDQFQEMFRKLCKIHWEDRVSMRGTVPTAYQYQPPIGGKPVGRRLRHALDYCQEINALLLGQPWPPVKQSEKPDLAIMDGANEMLAEELVYEDLERPEEEHVANHVDNGGVHDGMNDGEMKGADEAAALTIATSDDDDATDDTSMEMSEAEVDEAESEVEVEVETGTDAVLGGEDILSDVDSGVDLSAPTVTEDEGK